jgi:hypothetical protein
MKLSQKQMDRIEHIFKFIEYPDLTEWELNFVESVETQFGEKQFLSDKQINRLEIIFKESTER